MRICHSHYGRACDYDQCKLCQEFCQEPKEAEGQETLYGTVLLYRKMLEKVCASASFGVDRRAQPFDTVLSLNILDEARELLGWEKI